LGLCNPKYKVLMKDKKVPKIVGNEKFTVNKDFKSKNIISAIDPFYDKTIRETNTDASNDKILEEIVKERS